MPALTLTPNMIASEADWLAAVRGSSATKASHRRIVLEEASSKQLEILCLAIVMVLFKQIECSAAARGKIKESRKRKYIKKYFGNISVARKTLQDEHRLRQALTHIQGLIPTLLAPYFKC